MTESFLKQLEARARAVDSLLCIGLDPHPEFLPEPTGKAAYDFCVRLIDQTHDLACAFKPNSAFFEALGGAGFEALRDVVAYIHKLDSALPVILDAKRGDIASTAEAYARAAFEYLGVNALTLNPYMGRDAVEPFARNPEKGAFVLCHTSNPGAADFQDVMVGECPAQALYESIAEQVMTWNRAGNIGLVVGATDDHALRLVRAAAPEAWLLVPGVGAQGGELKTVVGAGLRTDGLGLLINVSRAIAKAADPRAEALRLRDEINAARRHHPRLIETALSPAARIASALVRADCIRFGKFTLYSGIESPFYIDLRRLVARPDSLRIVAELLAERLTALDEFDHIAAIPYAALPIGTVVAQIFSCSLIYPRREVKDYGTKAQVEGVFQPGDVAVVIDDLATTGESKFEAIDKLRAAGLTVKDILVVIDREQGARQTLAAAGYRFHAVVSLTELLDELGHTGHLSAEKRREIDAWLAAQKNK
jgi:uridine monophosphate synthetase